MAKEAHQLAIIARENGRHSNMMFSRKRQDEIDYLSKLQKNKFFRSLQSQFFKAVFPVGGTILNVCIALQDSITPKQKKELTAIGNQFVSLPFKLIAGEITLKQCLGEFVGTFNKLSNFLEKNVDIALKAGASLLRGLLPFGEFLGGAAKKIAEAALPKGAVEPLLRGLSALTKSYDTVTTDIERAPKLASVANRN